MKPFGCLPSVEPFGGFDHHVRFSLVSVVANHRHVATHTQFTFGNGKDLFTDV